MGEGAADPSAKTYSEEHRRMVGDVRWGHVYNDLCHRFYSRCDFWLNILQTAAGSAVLLGAATVFVADERGAVPPRITAGAGAALSVLALCGMFWQPAVRAEKHRTASAAFLTLYGRVWTTKTAQLSKELTALQGGAPMGLRGLEMPAYNRNMAFFEYPQEKLTKWERILDVLA
jgi:hypothetical protein